MSLYKRSYSKFEMKDDKRVITNLDRVIELDPKNAVFYFARGIAKSEIGDYRGAIADLDKAIELDPENVDRYRELIKDVKENLSHF